MGIGTIIVIILLGILVGYIIFIFNKIVKASNANFESFSNVDVALKKRFDLLPNLENIVKGFANHESVTLEKVTEMREALSQKMTVSDRQKQEDKYSALMKDVLACVENYPELKAGESFINLQNVLVKIESSPVRFIPSIELKEPSIKPISFNWPVNLFINVPLVQYTFYL